MTWVFLRVCDVVQGRTRVNKHLPSITVIHLIQVFVITVNLVVGQMCIY